MKNPKLILKADVYADTENAKNFINSDPEFIGWFLPEDLQYLLKNKVKKQKIEKISKEYAKKIFKDKNLEIKNNLKKAQYEWKSIENDYFKIVSKIFKNHPYPKGKYTGFASIFTMYPRHIHLKTFFFPGIIYSKKTPPIKTVIGHEMLHFIFFDYINRKYGLKTDSQIKGKEKDYLWKVSETFNSVIESWNPYYKIFNYKTPPYASKIFYKKMRPQWIKDPDIDKLLDKWLK